MAKARLLKKFRKTATRPRTYYIQTNLTQRDKHRRRCSGCLRLPSLLQSLLSLLVCGLLLRFAVDKLREIAMKALDSDPHESTI